MYVRFLKQQEAGYKTVCLPFSFSDFFQTCKIDKIQASQTLENS